MREFICGWYSPRGFANEGTNYYGTREQWRAVPKADVARWFIVSEHGTLENARKRAEREVKVSRKRIAWGEQDYTDAAQL